MKGLKVTVLGMSFPGAWLALWIGTHLVTEGVARLDIGQTMFGSLFTACFAGWIVLLISLVKELK